jgi:hypothetical protein
MTDSLFRSTARGREPLASASDAGEHVHYQPSRRVGIGSITSRKPGSGRPLTFFEVLALRMGVTLAEAKRLHAEGKVT